MAKITYENKVALNPQPSVANKNKVTDADMNEIKASVNDLYDEVDTNATYSSTEQRIGTWINGKPIYRKIYNNVNITTSNTDLIDISSLGIGSIVKIYGAIFTTSNNTFPVPLMDNSSTNYSVIFATASALRGRAIIGSGNLSNCWLAIEYTKSAD